MDAAIDRMKIGFLGLSGGAGTGFLSSVLARVLAEKGGYRPAVLELGSGGLYDSLGMDRRFSERHYFSFHKAVSQDKSIRGRNNESDGVNWALIPTGETADSLDLYRRIRLINNVSGDVILCRLAGLPEKDFWNVLREMDRIVLIIDPLPSKMLPGYELLCSLRISHFPVIYTVNKFNGGVYRRELLDYLKIKKLHYIPLISQEAIYGAEYTCRTAYDMAGVPKQLDKPLESLIKEIFAFSQ